MTAISTHIDAFYLRALKVGEPGRFRPGSLSEGQLKERSEGDQAQWQTALGEVLAAGSRYCYQASRCPISICRATGGVPGPKSQVPGPGMRKNLYLTGVSGSGSISGALKMGLWDKGQGTSDLHYLEKRSA